MQVLLDSGDQGGPTTSYNPNTKDEQQIGEPNDIEKTTAAISPANQGKTN
ncbi:MAG: hypothetical protein JO327_09400 [Nitrososphaeraceae archaeon]|nr:hypothetical protein [Nitrososphaeraceae archaeon]